MVECHPLLPQFYRWMRPLNGSVTGSDALDVGDVILCCVEAEDACSGTQDT